MIRSLKIERYTEIFFLGRSLTPKGHLPLSKTITINSNRKSTNHSGDTQGKTTIGSFPKSTKTGRNAHQPTPKHQITPNQYQP